MQMHSLKGSNWRSHDCFGEVENPHRPKAKMSLCAALPAASTGMDWQGGEPHIAAPIGHFQSCQTAVLDRRIDRAARPGLRPVDLSPFFLLLGPRLRDRPTMLPWLDVGQHLAQPLALDSLRLCHAGPCRTPGSNLYLRQRPGSPTFKKAP